MDMRYLILNKCVFNNILQMMNNFSYIIYDEKNDFYLCLKVFIFIENNLNSKNLF